MSRSREELIDRVPEHLYVTVDEFLPPGSAGQAKAPELAEPAWWASPPGKRHPMLTGRAP